MMYLLDFLNKIKYDSGEHPKDYTIVYYDTTAGINKELKFDYIKKIEGLFIVVEIDDEEVNLPIHRIKELKKNSQLIWKR